MTAKKDDTTNVTHFQHRQASKAQTPPDEAGPEEQASERLNSERPGNQRVGEVFVFPSAFGDRDLARIAKRLCEHMNLNYNLCCQLEHIADGLPDNVDRQECLYVARSVVPMVKLSHDFEESILFPLLKEKCGESEQLNQTLDRLQAEHWEDESYASEVHHGLISFASGHSDVNVDSLAYMLRGFFEGMRRHLAFEREHVLPLLQSVDARA